MQVILLEKVRNLGNLGDKVNVRNGYGRNFLIPQGKAVFATADNVKKFEERRAELEKAAAEALAAAKDRASKLEGMSVTIACKAGDEGKLFGSVGTNDIAEALSAAGAKVDKHEVLMPNGALREVGEYAVEIALHTDVTQAITVVVAPE